MINADGIIVDAELKSPICGGNKLEKLNLKEKLTNPFSLHQSSLSNAKNWGICASQRYTIDQSRLLHHCHVSKLPIYVCRKEKHIWVTGSHKQEIPSFLNWV